MGRDPLWALYDSTPPFAKKREDRDSTRRSLDRIMLAGFSFFSDFQVISLHPMIILLLIRDQTPSDIDCINVN